MALEAELDQLMGSLERLLDAQDKYFEFHGIQHETKEEVLHHFDTRQGGSKHAEQMTSTDGPNEHAVCNEDASTYSDQHLCSFENEGISERAPRRGQGELSVCRRYEIFFIGLWSTCHVLLCSLVCFNH